MNGMEFQWSRTLLILTIFMKSYRSVDNSRVRAEVSVDCTETAADGSRCVPILDNTHNERFNSIQYPAFLPESSDERRHGIVVIPRQFSKKSTDED